MNTIELKRSFHSLIDSIDNDCLLMNFYDLMKTRTSTKEGQLWNRLTEDEQEKLLMTLEESENPESLISHEEMKKKHKKWLYKSVGQSGQTKNLIRFLNTYLKNGVKKLPEILSRKFIAF